MLLRGCCNRLQQQFPEVQAVSCGAILSDYQRIRVEYVYVKLSFNEQL